MSYKNNTPCNSNDYMMFALNFGNDDDGNLVQDFVSCSNETSVASTSSTTVAAAGVTTTTTTSTASSESSVGQGNSANGMQHSGADYDMSNAEEDNGGTDDTDGQASSTQGNEQQQQDQLNNGSHNQNQEVIETVVTENESEFYTCHPDPSALLSGDLEPSSDTGYSKIYLEYDYELHSVEEKNDVVKMDIKSVENDVLRDLAMHYGLINCQDRVLQSVGRILKRRSLREKSSSNSEELKTEVLALSSDPEDELLIGEYDCQVQVDLPSLSVCTPIRGRMSVWIKTDTSSDTSIPESQILSCVQSGMINDKYTTDDILKLSYIGPRASSNNNDQQVDQMVGSSDNNDSNISSPLLAIGLSVMALALAVLVLFILYIRKKRNALRDNDTHASSPRSVTQSMPVDLGDDINLLPSPEKLDMRLVVDEDDFSDSNTESNTLEEEEEERESSYGVQQMPHHMSGSGSSLAAMGAASTLTTRLSKDTMT